MSAAELIGQLEACPDEELAAAAERLAGLAERARRRRLIALAKAAADELGDEPAMDAAGIRAYLGRDRGGA